MRQYSSSAGSFGAGYLVKMNHIQYPAQTAKKKRGDNGSTYRMDSILVVDICVPRFTDEG